MLNIRKVFMMVAMTLRTLMAENFGIRDNYEPISRACRPGPFYLEVYMNDERAADPAKCEAACTADARCVAYEWEWVDSEPGERVCELHDQIDIEASEGTGNCREDAFEVNEWRCCRRKISTYSPTYKPTLSSPSKTPTYKPTFSSPSKSPTYKPTLPSPSKSPTLIPTLHPTDPFISPTQDNISSVPCTDSSTWYKKGDPSRSCAWVSMHSPRCGVKGNDGTLASYSCPIACNTSCLDSSSWYKNGDPSKDCTWVSTYATRRCSVKGIGDSLASEACPTACAENESN